MSGSESFVLNAVGLENWSFVVASFQYCSPLPVSRLDHVLSLKSSLLRVEALRIPNLVSLRVSGLFGFDFI